MIICLATFDNDSGVQALIKAGDCKSPLAASTADFISSLLILLFALELSPCINTQCFWPVSVAGGVLANIPSPFAPAFKSSNAAILAALTSAVALIGSDSNSCLVPYLPVANKSLKW